MTAIVPENVELLPYAPEDLDLLRRANTPELMDQMGGVEDEAAVHRRHERYLLLPIGHLGQQFRVIIPGHPEGVGMVGYWVRTDIPERTLECGWSIEAQYRGRGIATIATTTMIQFLREGGETCLLHAYPRIDNAASNAVCRKAGFSLVGAVKDPSVGAGEIELNDYAMEL
ncbi:GNAT family N-acetyltransferase [Demequina aurantiaca]|uniref:GNAT family N-acetyltransferase n=1 Tax=Demequina aurantiaca TaxID=676200 RepID=UPI000783548B|nr:GNAT family protein [Demequina aurantiaca]